MADYRYDKIIKYVIQLSCDGPLHIGTGDGDQGEVLIHPVDGAPFVQASGIAGVLRSCCKEQSEELSRKLFGSATDTQSRIRISDGYFLEQTSLELRPHVRIEPASGVVENGKFEMQYIGAGSAFCFEAYLYEDSQEESMQPAFEQILSAVQKNELRFGAKKSSGAGKVSLQKAYKKEFILSDPTERKLWIDEDALKIPDDYQDITNKLPESTITGSAYRVHVEAATEGAIQIKGISVSGTEGKAPDSENIKNAKQQMIVPGSSMKGAFRSRIEKIARYIDRPELIAACFGSSKDETDKDRQQTGNLFFEDVIIQNDKDKNLVRTRIHIDKFTGGVMHSALFQEKNTCGDMEFDVHIRSGKYADEAFALLILALRDLSIGTFNLGNGYNVGKGFVEVRKITIAAKDGSTAELFPENQGIQDEKKIIEAAIQKLHRKEVAQ